MTINERVREARKTLNLTLEVFGARIGVGKTAISKIENGKVGITEQMKKTICREFNVSYDWLEYGQGEMFSDLPKSILGDICRAYGCDEDDLVLIETYLESGPDMRAAIRQFFKNFAQKK